MLSTIAQKHKHLMQRLRSKPEYKMKEQARNRVLYKDNTMQRQQRNSRLEEHERLAKRVRMQQYMVDYRKKKREKKEMVKLMEEKMQLEEQLVAAPIC